jgi:hypothetical protein
MPRAGHVADSQFKVADCCLKIKISLEDSERNKTLWTKMMSVRLNNGCKFGCGLQERGILRTLGEAFFASKFPGKLLSFTCSSPNPPKHSAFHNLLRRLYSPFLAPRFEY